MDFFKLKYLLLFIGLLLVGIAKAQDLALEYGNQNVNERGAGIIPFGNGLMLYGDDGNNIILTEIDLNGCVIETNSIPLPTAITNANISLTKLILFNGLLYGSGFGNNGLPGSNSVSTSILYCFNPTTNTLSWMNTIPFCRYFDLTIYNNNLLASGEYRFTNNPISISSIHSSFTLNGALVPTNSFNSRTALGTNTDSYGYKSTIIVNNNILSTGRLMYNSGNATRMRASISSFTSTGANNWNKSYITPLNINGRSYSSDLINIGNNLYMFASGDDNGTSVINTELFFTQTNLQGLNVTTNEYSTNNVASSLASGMIQTNGTNFYLTARLGTGATESVILLETDNIGTLQRQFVTSIQGFSTESISTLNNDHSLFTNNHLYITMTGTDNNGGTQMILLRVDVNNIVNNCALSAIAMNQNITSVVDSPLLVPVVENPVVTPFTPITGLDTIPESNLCCPDSLFILDSVNIVNPLCRDDTLGSIMITGLIGQGPYTFELYSTSIAAPFQTLEESDSVADFTGLSVGSYFISVKDSIHCRDTFRFDIVAPDSIVISGVASHESCLLLDGMISTTISGGTPPYTYYWTGPNGFTSLSNPITNLAPGAYRFFVEDSLGCASVAPFLILPGEDPNYGVSLNDSIYCIGDLWCLNVTGDSGEMTMVINGQTTSFTNIPLPFEFNPFCDSLFLEDLPDFNIGVNEICVYFESDSGNCTDTICLDFFIDDCCDYNPTINVSDSLICGSQEFEYQYGPSSWHQINFTFNNFTEFGEIVRSDTTFGFDPITSTISGMGNLDGLPPGEVVVTIVMYEDDTLGCSDTTEQIFFIEECCDYNPTLTISDDTLCEFEPFTFAFGPSEWHEFIFEVDGMVFSNGNILSSDDNDYQAATGMIIGIDSLDDIPGNMLDITLVMYEGDTLGCSDTLYYTFFLEDNCDSILSPCEEFEGLAGFEYVVNNDGTVSFTDTSSSNGPTPDYIIWVFPNETINASPNSTIDYEFDYSDSITVCMIAAYFHDENSDDCCFDTICQPIYINNLCWDLDIETNVIMDIDPFNPLHYYFENISTPAPASNYMWSIDGGSFVTSYDHTFDYYFTTDGPHTIVARTIWHLAEDSNLCCIEDLVINIVINDSIDCEVVEENITLDVSPLQVSPLTTRQFTLNFPSGLTMSINSINWDFDDVNSTNPQTSNLDYVLQHTFVNAGMHNVCAEISYTTINGIECLVNKCVQIEVLPFNLTPNPANKNVYINYESSEMGTEYQYEIYDVSGKLVTKSPFTSSNIGNNKEKVGINFLSHGTYYLSFYKQGILVGTENFIKE